MTPGQADTTSLALRLVLGAGLWSGVLAIMALLLFLPAGRLDWAAGWTWLAVMATGLALAQSYIRRRNPGLLQRRLRIGPGTPLWDRIFVAIVRLSFVTTLVVAGLDAGRFGRSPLPPGLRGAGGLVVAAGLFLLGWSMGQNPHFETTVRIQRERGHRVVDTGPYRFVRHPGYVGVCLVLVGSPLLLGSGGALIPAGVGTLCTVVRTALEDRFLRAGLQGYPHYAERVRHRLIPGVW